MNVWYIRVLLSLVGLLALAAWAVTMPGWLTVLDAYPHLQRLSDSVEEVRDYEIGTGALQKRNGVWRFKASLRVSGALTRTTWQVVDGYTSLEVYEQLVAAIAEDGNAELLFHCEARSCGPSVQWANRVFGERLLYGREESQRYSVYKVSDGEAGGSAMAVVYASGRTAERQYMHVDWLAISGD